MRQFLFRVMIALMVLLPLVALDSNPVIGQASTPSDLINAVNSLRQSQGLAPYTVDNYLMGFAQSHSDYMASIGNWTHTRADGSTAFDYGIKENVAMGTNMSVSYCIYSVWSDWVHWQTMTAYETGKVGAGVTVIDGVTYYTLNVLPGEIADPKNINNEEDDEPVAAIVPVQQVQETPAYLIDVITSTPDADGIIIHVVSYGETLWTIAEAYGVTIDEILRNSGLSPTTTEVLAGQTLLIQPAEAVTPSVTPSQTPTIVPDTPTPTQPRPTMTPFPTRTPAPTFTPTPPPSVLHQTFGNAKTVGIGLILLSGLGLIFVIYLGFIKKSQA